MNLLLIKHRHHLVPILLCLNTDLPDLARHLLLYWQLRARLSLFCMAFIFVTFSPASCSYVALIVDDRGRKFKYLIFCHLHADLLAG